MRLSLLLLALCLSTGCAAAHSSLRGAAELAPLALAPAPAPLVDNHFLRDRSAVNPSQLKEILAAPVFLEANARVGIVPVASGYGPDQEVPREGVPATLAEALEGSGLFDMASEVSTGWPADSGLPGLQELAARYRTEYLVLYRHRFVEESHSNGWAAGYATVVGALFFPGQTLEADGLLEATLYDVKTGTILFTVNERVHRSAISAPPMAAGKLAALRSALLAEGGPRLAQHVLSRCRKLAALRPLEAPAAAVALTVEPLR